jgi:Tol biopolymer transport system component
MKRAILVLVVAFAAAAAPVAAAPGPSGVIAYVSRAGCNGVYGNVYVLDTASGVAKQLTYECADDFEVRWSPDGNQLLFSSFRDGGPALYVMDADGTDVRRLTPIGAGADTFGWARNGRIFFSRGQLWSMAPDGSDMQPVGTVQDAQDPSLSPNGVALTYATQTTNADGAIMLTSIEGDGERAVGIGTDPAFSPDGNKLLWVARAPSGDAVIEVASADGSNPQPLVDVAWPSVPPFYELRPAWSRDGEWIAFAEVGGLFVVPATGGTPARLAPGYVNGADWRPDVTSTGLVITHVAVAHGACANRAFALAVTVADAQGHPLSGTVVNAGSARATTGTDGTVTLRITGVRAKTRRYVVVKATAPGRPAAQRLVSVPRCRS